MRLGVFRTFLVAFVAVAISQFASVSSHAQIVISLPTVRTFNVNTTVMVPDGGQMILGGVNRGAYGSVGRGLPGLSGLPGAGRAFRNRGIGRSTGSSTASVTARVISLREQENQVMAEANRRMEVLAKKNRNLDPKVLRQAQKMSRSIGRRNRR